MALSFVAGCLQTTSPAFDETNSVAAAESAALAALALAWDGYYDSPEDGPRELMETPGARAVEIGDMIVVQAPDFVGDPETGARRTVWLYVAYRMQDARPVHCVIDADETIHGTARDLGVEIVVEGHGEDYPPDVTASGDPAALFAFVRQVFTTGDLACGPTE